MFFLSTVQDSVKLSPGKLRHDFIDAIKLALNKRYCNKVIVNVGLCISIFDVLEAGDPYVYQGEADSFVKTKFRVVIFRPFIGELLEGKIRTSTAEGIKVNLDFFEDILIPPSCMQAETSFEAQEQVWVWNYQGTQLYLDPGETIRFRVLSEIFSEAPPVQKDVLMAQRLGIQDMDTEIPALPLFTPFKLIATIAEDGLGLPRWWQTSAACIESP